MKTWEPDFVGISWVYNVYDTQTIPVSYMGWTPFINLTLLSSFKKDLRIFTILCWSGVCYKKHPRGNHAEDRLLRLSSSLLYRDDSSLPNLALFRMTRICDIVHHALDQD